MRPALILLMLTASLSVFANPGTMSTDVSRASQAEASLSGYRTTGFEELQEQEEKPEPTKREEKKPPETESKPEENEK